MASRPWDFRFRDAELWSVGSPWRARGLVKALIKTIS